MTKQIIAAGTCILPDEATIHYLVAIIGKPNPRICLLPTPAGDNKEVIWDFMRGFRSNNFEAQLDYLPLFHTKEKDHLAFLKSFDAIVVPGGHSKTALGVWREWGLDKVLLEAYDSGVILAGGSAGAVVWSEAALTDSYGDLRPMDFMNFLPGFSLCPHYRAEERRKIYRSAILNGEISPGYGIADGAAIHFVDGKFHRAISSSTEASVFYVNTEGIGKHRKSHSERMPISYLGDRKTQEELIWSSTAFQPLAVSVEAESVETHDSP